MIDYLIDDNLDLVLPLQKVTVESELLFQQVQLLLETYTYDFPYDVTAGMPYEESIITGRDVDSTELETIYYRKISVLEHFYKMTDFSIAISPDRNMSISFKVYSSDGYAQAFSQDVA